MGFFRLALKALRWVTGMPRVRQLPAWRLWAGRVLPPMCAAWLVTFGPATLLMPYHWGFNSVYTGVATIYFEPSVPQKLVDQTRAAAEQAFCRASEFWGEVPRSQSELRIYLCGCQTRYKQLSLGAGGNACVAGSRNILVYPAGISGGPQNLPAILTHEMSHALLRLKTGCFRALAIPTWLDEGIATYLGTPTWASPEALNRNLRAMLKPQLVVAMDLASGAGWASAAEQAGSGSPQYAHARSLVEFLIIQYGKEAVRNCALDASLGASTDCCVREFGTALGNLETRWLHEAKSGGQIPQATVFVRSCLHFSTVAWMCVRYGFLLLCGLWAIRQFSRFCRWVASWQVFSSGPVQ